MSMGTYANFCTNGTNVMDKFPGMKIRICTLVGHLCMPFRREWAMLHGLVNCSRESLHYLLDESRNKGNIVVLVVGKGEEIRAFYMGNFNVIAEIPSNIRRLLTVMYFANRL